MSRILADKVTNYNNDGPFEAEKGINIPLNRPLQVADSPGLAGQVLSSTGTGLTWTTLPNIFSGNYNDLTNKPLLFSGSYTDLTGRPFVPTFEITSASENDYLKYDGTVWVNASFPTIFTYTHDIYEASANDIKLELKNNLNNVVSGYAMTGTNGIEITMVDSTIQIAGQSVVSYDPITAIDDISYAFTHEFHSGIIFEYTLSDPENPTPRYISATVAVQDFNINGSSSSDDSVTIGLSDPESTLKGSVTLTADGGTGLSLSWDEGSATGILSWSDPSPYTLPTASTTDLGGVKVDGSTITIDGNGIITANFIDTGIEYTDLSVEINLSGPTATGGLAYNENTGTFTYTPVSIALENVSDVVYAETLGAGDLLTSIGPGNGWTTTTVGNVLSNASITDLLDVTDIPTLGYPLVYNGNSFETVETIPYTYIDFSGSTVSSTTITAGDPIVGDVFNPFLGDYPPIVAENILRANHGVTEINVSIYAEGENNTVGTLRIQRRVDTFDPPSLYIEGTWTDVKTFRTSSDVLNYGPTTIFLVDNHGTIDSLEKVNYRIVADTNIVLYYGYHNVICTKQLS